MDHNTNVQGGNTQMVKTAGGRGQIRRALSVINQNSVVKNTELSKTINGIYDKNSKRELGAAEMGTLHQHCPQKNKKLKLATEEFTVWEDNDITETFSNDNITEIEEVEMEDVFEEALVDIDSDDTNNPLAVVDYVGDFYANCRKMEVYSCVSPKYMGQQFEINERMRGVLIDWIIEVHDMFELKEETLFLTVNLLDRFLEKQTVAKDKLQLVGLVALLLASKYEETYAPLVHELVIISCNTYTRKDVLQMEKLMLNTLQFTMSLPTPYVFMRRFLKAAQADKKLEELSFFLIELCLVEYEVLQHSPSFMAAAAIYTARCTLYGVKEWSRTCEWHTGYSEDSLMECAKLIVSYHQKAKTGRLMGVHNKYSASKFGYVAKIEPAHFLVQIQ